MRLTICSGWKGSEKGIDYTPKLKQSQKDRTMFVTVDLTDNEPPTKVYNLTTPSVRVVPSRNLMANPRQPFPTAVGPRQVYIPRYYTFLYNSIPRQVYIPIFTPWTTRNQNIFNPCTIPLVACTLQISRSRIARIKL